MEFIKELESRIFEALKLEKPNRPELYIAGNPNHRLIEFPRKEEEPVEKTIETIAKTAEDFLVHDGFRIFDKREDYGAPYKTQFRAIEKEGKYYLLVIGGRQRGDPVYRMDVRRVDFPAKN